MSRFSFSRPSIITFSAALGFLLGLGLLFVVSEAIVLLPLALQGSIVHIPSFFGTDLNFLLGYFACFAVAGGLLGLAATRRKKLDREGKTQHHEPGSGPRSSFTLIELLIVIAVIAVLATVIILVLNPAELLRQSRDANRASDLATMNQALTLYNVDVVGGNMGSSSVVYVSVPDLTATSTWGTDCAGLGLAASSLPSGWAWHCAASSTYRKVNGLGWLPVDFTKVSSGSPLGNLPVDPTNTTSTGLYYAYVVQGDPWEMTAKVEATKNMKGGMANKDGGSSSLALEVGTDLSLTPSGVIGRGATYAELTSDESALVGYWKFDEGTGSSTIDSSGDGNNGVWYGTPAGTSGYYSAGKVGNWAGYFSNNSIGIPIIHANQQITIAVWIKAVSTSYIQLIVHGGSSDQFRIQADGNLWFYSASGNSINLSTVGLNAADGNWHFVTAVSDGTSAYIYVDGIQKASSTGSLNQNGWSQIGTYNGVDLFAGSMDDLRIYNRALSASEVQAIYNAEK